MPVRCLRGGEAAVKIEVPVAGVQDLYLLVTGVPDVVGGAARGPTPG